MKFILISGVAASAAILAAGFAFAAGRIVESHDFARLGQPDLAAAPRAVQADRADPFATRPLVDSRPKADVAGHAPLSAPLPVPPRPVPRSASSWHPEALPSVKVAAPAFTAPTPPDRLAPLPAMQPTPSPAAAPSLATDFAFLPQIGVYR